MSAPSEPEKYSIDEMMERLKHRPAEDPLHDGELVTRADGTTAVKVRKRKRRSHQPHKEERRHNRRARMFQVSGALILVMLAVLAAVAGIVYANSAPFIQGLVKKIGVSSGAEVELQQFRMNPTSANAGGVTLTWPEGNAIREIKTRGVRAEVFPASFLGKSMVGEEVTAVESTMTLRIPDSSKPARVVPAGEGLLPVRFKRYASHKFNLNVGEPTAPLVRMLNSEASLLPESAVGRTQLLLNNGDITIVGWPKLRLDRSHIEFRGSEVDVIGMRIRHETDSEGVFELKGTVSPYAPDRASTLAATLESFQLGGISGPEFAKLFAGRLDTESSAKSNYLSFTPGPNPGATMVLEVRNSLGSTMEVSSFPFLMGLVEALDNKWFVKPVFESDVKGVLRREAGGVALTEINFQNKDYMALRGDVQMSADRRLSGTLEVGITEAMIKSARIRRLDAMFGPSKEGYRWVSLTIGGTVAGPTDNFLALFEAASKPETATPANKIPSFEDLTQPE